MESSTLCVQVAVFLACIFGGVGPTVATASKEDCKNVKDLLCTGRWKYVEQFTGWCGRDSANNLAFDDAANECKASGAYLTNWNWTQDIGSLSGHKTTLTCQLTPSFTDSGTWMGSSNSAKIDFKAVTIDQSALPALCANNEKYACFIKTGKRALKAVSCQQKFRFRCFRPHYGIHRMETCLPGDPTYRLIGGQCLKASHAQSMPLAKPCVAGAHLMAYTQNAVTKLCDEIYGSDGLIWTGLIQTGVVPSMKWSPHIKDPPTFIPVAFSTDESKRVLHAAKALQCGYKWNGSYTLEDCQLQQGSSALYVCRQHEKNKNQCVFHTQAAYLQHADSKKYVYSLQSRLFANPTEKTSFQINWPSFSGTAANIQLNYVAFLSYNTENGVSKPVCPAVPDTTKVDINISPKNDHWRLRFRAGSGSVHVDQALAKDSGDNIVLEDYVKTPKSSQEFDILMYTINIKDYQRHLGMQWFAMSIMKTPS